jgi:UDPglucose 6-dehydrogenase
VGCADTALPLPPVFERFLASFDCPILPMRYESAELCKISINMFLVASVSTTNMLAELCEAIGAEWREIAPALRLDQRIGPHAYLTPGLGVGGGNLTRDLETVRNLARQHGSDAGIIDAWNANTRRRKDWSVATVRKTLLSDLPHASLGVWGLTYKENTQVTKNSPAMHLINQLRGVPIAAYDPAARLDPAESPSWLRVVTSPLEACSGADGLVVMTPWPEFSKIDPAAIAAVMRGRVLIDPFGSIDAVDAHRHGFSYYRLGAGRLSLA